MPRDISYRPLSLFLCSNPTHFSQTHQRYYRNLLAMDFKLSQLNRLTHDQMKALHRCAAMLLNAGYSKKTLARIAENKDTKMSLFNLARIHKVLTILNIKKQPFKTITTILFRTNKSASIQLQNAIHQIYCHAFSPTNLKPVKTATASINQLLYLLGIRKIFGSKDESLFLSCFKIKGTGIPLPVKLNSSIPSKQNTFSIKDHSWFTNLAPPALHDREVAELLTSLNEGSHCQLK